MHYLKYAKFRTEKKVYPVKPTESAFIIQKNKVNEVQTVKISWDYELISCCELLFNMKLLFILFTFGKTFSK